MAKKSYTVPPEARPMSVGALQSPTRPPADSGVIDAYDSRRNMYGVSICPKCGHNHRYPLARDLVIHCDDCGFTEQGYYRPNTETWD